MNNKSAKMLLKLILPFCLVLDFALADETQCKLPKACHIQKVNSFIYANGVEKMRLDDTKGLFCKINQDFSFEMFNLIDISNCTFNLNDYPNIELQWPNTAKKAAALTKSNIDNLFGFIYLFISSFSLNQFFN